MSDFLQEVGIPDEQEISLGWTSGTTTWVGHSAKVWYMVVCREDVGNYVNVAGPCSTPTGALRYDGTLYGLTGLKLYVRRLTADGARNANLYKLTRKDRTWKWVRLSGMDPEY